MAGSMSRPRSMVRMRMVESARGKFIATYSRKGICRPPGAGVPARVGRAARMLGPLCNVDTLWGRHRTVPLGAAPGLGFRNPRPDECRRADAPAPGTWKPGCRRCSSSGCQRSGGPPQCLQRRADGELVGGGLGTGPGGGENAGGLTARSELCSTPPGARSGDRIGRLPGRRC